MADQGAITPTTGRVESVSLGSDWPAQAADTVVRVVDQVKGKTTDKAILVVRAIVYGLLAGILGSAAMILGAILAVRLVNAYLPDAVFGEQHMWAAHGLIGALFVLVGMVLWSRRHASAS